MNKNLVAYHDDVIFDQGRSHKKTVEEMEENFRKVAEERQKTNEGIDELILKYNKRITDINRTLTADSQKITFINEEINYF